MKCDYILKKAEQQWYQANSVISIYLVKFISKDTGWLISIDIFPDYQKANGYGFCSTFLVPKRPPNIPGLGLRQLFLLTIAFNCNILHRKTAETLADISHA